MIDTIVVAIYLTLVLAIGLWKAGKLKTLEEYAVARRSYGALVIFATMSASFIGGGFSIGNAEKVFCSASPISWRFGDSVSRKSWSHA